MVFNRSTPDTVPRRPVALYFPLLTSPTPLAAVLPLVMPPFEKSQTLPAKHLRKTTMFIGTLNEVNRNHRIATGYKILSLFVAFLFALTIYPGKARAQVIGEMEANIPFAFYAGNAKFPAGQYIIRVLDGADTTVMEISSSNGSTSTLFEVHSAEANSTPAKSELIFNKYGDSYFLAKLFDEGNASGSAVVESLYEQRVSRATLEAQTHVPAHRRHSQGN
jgi:hypothetical protein